MAGYWYEDWDGLGREIWLDTGNVWRASRVHENAPWEPFDILDDNLTEAEWRAYNANARCIEALPEGLHALLAKDFPRALTVAWEAASYPEWQGYYRLRLKGGRALYDAAENYGADRVILVRGTVRRGVGANERIELVRIMSNGEEREHA